MTTRRRENAFCRYCGVELCTVQGKRPQDCEYWDDFWKEYGGRKQ